MEFPEFIEHLLGVKLKEFQKVAINNFVECNHLKSKPEKNTPSPPPPPIPGPPPRTDVERPSITFGW